MKKLNISLSVSTELDDREIVDMLVDGFIDLADLKTVSVNGRKYTVNDSVFEIGLRAREPGLGARKTRRENGSSVSREHSERDAVGLERLREAIQSDS